MLDHAKLRLELSGENAFGPCDCCGQMTRRVWGFVYDEKGAALSAYFVAWIPGHRPTTATLDLIIGRWGEDTTADDRHSVALDFRHDDSGPSFMVVDAADRQVAKSSLISEALTRERVLDSPVVSDVFAMCDAVYLQEPRIAELRHDEASTY